MSTPFLGEVRIVSFNFAPKGWALCNGQVLPINQNQALFSILGTMYGGNGQTTFALPNLQGRVPIHQAAGYVEGQAAGTVSETIITTTMPAHTHIVSVSTSADNTSPSGTYPGTYGANTLYASAPNVSMNPADVSSVGGSQAHNNMQPYLVLNFVIALQGIFPSRN